MYGSMPEPATSRRLAICLINPRSRPSYWTADFAMPFYGLGRRLKYSMANGSLVAVAALVPPEHDVVGVTPTCVVVVYVVTLPTLSVPVRVYS